jgi:hypothetical protein
MSRIELGDSESRSAAAVGAFAQEIMHYVEDGLVVPAGPSDFVDRLEKAIKTGKEAAEKEHTYYAVVRWMAGDVTGMKKDWTEEQAHDWLADNAKYVEDAMVEAGNNALEQLLPGPISYEDDEEEDDDDDEA